MICQPVQGGQTLGLGHGQEEVVVQVLLNAFSAERKILTSRLKY